MKQQVATLNHRPVYVPLQMGQPITDRNHAQMQCKANSRQQGQPLPQQQQR